MEGKWGKAVSWRVGCKRVRGRYDLRPPSDLWPRRMTSYVDIYIYKRSQRSHDHLKAATEILTVVHRAYLKTHEPNDRSLNHMSNDSVVP